MNEQEIFSAALECAPESRSAYLDEACGDDANLCQRVEALLGLHAKAGAFIEKPAAEIVATQQAPSLLREPGDMIGVYKLGERLAEGGMGVCGGASRACGS